MELELCDFELSVMLKEIGFDWNVNTYYFQVNDKKCGQNTWNHKENFNFNKNKISAPTLELAKQWFREMCDIHIVLIVNPYSEDELYGFKIYGNSDDGMRCIVSKEELNVSYNQALLIGLKEVCKLIKTN
jgi:hypothetical protein